MSRCASRTGAGESATVHSKEPLGGVWVAAMTAFISGLSIFVNSYGVGAFSSPAVYTTAKNLVAALVLVVATLFAVRRPARRRPLLSRWACSPNKEHSLGGDRLFARRELTGRRPRAVGWWLGLGYVGVVGGGAAFVLFFEGLASTAPTSAAFLHDGLVVWVSLLAVSLLREHLRMWNLVAIAFLMAGQVAVLGGVGQLAASRGEMLVLSATLLWAVEVVVSKSLLRGTSPAFVSLVRMGGGSLVLLGYLAVEGGLPALASLSASQLGWVLVTGLLLAGYVASWLTALSRAPAVEVTSVLVGSTLVTSLLSALAGTLPLAPALGGLVLIAFGIAMFMWQGIRRVAA